MVKAAIAGVMVAGALVWSAPERVYPIRAVDHADVELTDGFWRDRLEVNRLSSIPAILKQNEITGRDDTAGIYNAIEAASYSLKRTSDPALSSQLDRIIGLTARADEPNGHLYEAAVAHFEATGKRTLLDVALKNANLVAAATASGARRSSPEPDQIEMALIRLFRFTGVPRYYDAARLLLDKRGPDREEGNAVRAVYLYSAMADVAGLEGDRTYLAAVERIWRDMVSKMSLTGAIDAEPCASAGNVFWNARMFMTTGNSAYLDVLERTLYNDLISGVSLADCPANLARTIAQMPGYIYAYEGETIFVNLYTGSRALVPLGRGAVRISQQTNYPWDGEVRIRVEPQAPRMFTVAFRNPAWTGERPFESDLYRYADARRLPPPVVEVNGQPFIDIRGRSGFITVMREWKAGDEIRVRFAMPVRRVLAHQSITDNAGKVAFERGPLVYAVEPHDNGGAVLDLVVPDDAPIDSTFRRNLLGGVQVLTGQALRGTRRMTFTAIPYFAWANRGAGDRAVWVRAR